MFSPTHASFPTVHSVLVGVVFRENYNLITLWLVPCELLPTVEREARREIWDSEGEKVSLEVNFYETMIRVGKTSFDAKSFLR